MRVVPERIVVADETSLSELGVKSKRYAPNGVKRVDAIVTGFTGTLTCLASATGTGSALPPFLVVNAKGDMCNTHNRDEWRQCLNGWPSARVAFNPSTSSITADLFREYGDMLSVVCKSSVSDPIFLIIDGPSVHSDVASWRHLTSIGVIPIFLPAHATSLLQVPVGCLCMQLEISDHGTVSRT